MDEQCINELCEKIAYCRGLCRYCYESLRERVADGQTTWQKLARSGKCLDGQRSRYSRPQVAAQWLHSDQTVSEDAEPCIVPNCESRENYSRGTCQKCYNSIHKFAIYRGLTLDDMARKGKLLPKRSQRDHKSRISKWLVEG